MTSFDIVRHTFLSAEEAWSRLTDWERHSEFIPLTSIQLSNQSSTGAGAAFVARTSLGPVGFNDPMEVTVWQPPAGLSPGLCRIVKRGRVVVGWAQLTVAAAPRGALVHWHEEAGFSKIGGLLNRPTRLAGRVAFGRLIDGLLTDTSA